MKIFITGTEGFIGGALKKAISSEHQITELDDILSLKNWQGLIRGILENGKFDAVFHVGACSDTQNYDISYVGPRNIESTFLIADICQKQKIPLIYSSSASVYGNHGTPETLYAWSKYIGERYVLKTGGIALRYFNVYGFDETRKGKMASFAYQAYRMAKMGAEIQIFPPVPDKPMRDFVYVYDVLSANLHALAHYESLKGNYYDVGTGTPATYESLMEALGVEYVYSPKDSIPKNYQYFTKATKFMLGWSSKWSLQEGISDYTLILNQLSL